MQAIREQILPPSREYSSEIEEFSQSINVPPVIGRILADRGVDTFDKARTFFRPSLDFLNDPFQMMGIKEATSRICQSISAKETIALYGDYDVDGITACALVFRALKSLGAEITTYLPNRLEEGYGLTEEGIREIVRAKARLLVTLDCGITACAEVAAARQAGIDVVITDHHEPGRQMPEALAVVNPKQKGCTYPEKELAGVGVAFKLVQAVFAKMGMAPDKALEYLDLVALGSAADIVPLLGENRTLVRFGLDRIARTTNTGLRELLRATNLWGNAVSTSNVVFQIAPMINAVGRLGSPQRAFNLLVTENTDEARSMVRVLQAENERRRDVDKQVTEEAVALAENTIDEQNDFAIVLASRNWHVGVIGIVASRLVERFYRPTILISVEEDGKGRGSGRSVRDFHILDALSQCESHLIKYGGHKYAAGLSIQESNIDAFRKQLNSVARDAFNGIPPTPVVQPSGHLRLGEVDPRLMRLLKLFEPYGPGNRRPVFYSDNVNLAGTPAVVGKTHLKFKAAQDSAAFDAIAFGMGNRVAEVETQHHSLSLAFGLEENVWNGRSRIQLKIKGIA